MGDVDVLDMLFDGDNGILDLVGCGERSHNSTTTTTSSGAAEGRETHNNSSTTATSSMMLGTNFDVMESDWSTSSLLSPSSLVDTMDHNEFFSALMETNLPDDVKQQQQFHQPQQKQVSDHAYSITPASPHSDSGVSSAGPYSPSSSGNDIEELTFDIDRDLFGPLDLKTYDNLDDDLVTGVDPMLLDSLSECSSTSPALTGNESPVRFDFGELSENSSQPAVQGLTISTDETTKVIKVLSVNGSTRSQTIQHLSSKQKPVTTDSPYPELMLSDEEKDLLRKEGISLPSHLPLTREEEKVLRSVRRRIRNKASARNSRRKKQDYMEALEKRVKLCTDEKRQLEKKVIDLEKRNSSLIGQLKKLQKLVTDGTRQTAKTGTCAMILALSFALVLLPNYRSLVGSNDSKHDTLMQVPSDVGGRPARSLLSKPDDFISTSQHTEKSFNYIPFLNFNNAPSMVSPARDPVDEPVEGDELYSHDSVAEISSFKRGVVSSADAVDEKVIHMEITKLPDDESPSIIAEADNQTAKVSNLVSGEGVKQRHIRMDLSDEL